MTLSPLTKLARIGSLAVISAAMFFTPALVTAGTDSWTESTVAPGVVWKWRVYTSLFGGKQTVHVIEADMNDGRVEIKPILATGGGCETTSSMGSRTGAVAAINGGFFDGSCNSVSMFKLNDVVSAVNPGWKPARATFGVDQSTGTPYIDWVSSTDSWSAVDDAVGGGPNLVTNGAVDVTMTAEGFDSSYANRNPRTAVGYTTANKLMLVTVDGRTSAGIGMTLNELATYMTWLGCTKAINLDGGGSTTMWVSGNGVANTPSDGSQRSVVTGLGVYSIEDATIIDNEEAGYSETGTWSSSANSGFYGSNSRWTSTDAPSASATWTPTLDPGTYEVSAWWVAANNRANNAVYQIHHTGGVSNIPANQSQNGGKWNSLGTYSFNTGTVAKVVLSDSAQAGKVVSADALKWVYIGPPAPIEVVVDNSDSTTVKSGNWFLSTSTSGYLGGNYQARATASTSDAFTWRANLPQTGSYEVFARWTTASNRATAAPYIVVHSGGSTTVSVNQTQSNGQWVSLGSYNFDAGTFDRVRLSCWTGSGDYVIADAVKLLKN